jgi:Fur family iron response transcriptional regulator
VSQSAFGDAASTLRVRDKATITSNTRQPEQGPAPMTRTIAPRQRSSTARGRENNGHNRPAGAELQRLKDELRRAGLLPTRPRLLITRLLKREGLRYVTPEKLHSEARSSGANVSLATCYNTLEVLVERGLVRRVLFEHPKQFYDADPSQHVHIYFEDTGALDALPSECLSVVQNLLSDIPADRINLLVWISRSPAA